MLYEDLRPQTAAALRGNAQEILRGFINTIRGGGEFHSFVFSGQRGCGKTSSARILARAINCENPPAPGECCNVCDGCKASMNQPCLVEYDAANCSKAEDARDLVETMEMIPSGRYSVYILDEAHNMSKTAFDVLLKTIEEPRSSLIIILCTTEIQKIPVTIRSRCARLQFPSPTLADLTAYATEVCANIQLEASAEDIAYLAIAADGSYRDLLTLIDSARAAGSVAAVNRNIGIPMVTEVAQLFLTGNIQQAATVIRDRRGEYDTCADFLGEVFKLVVDPALANPQVRPFVDTLLQTVVRCGQTPKGLQPTVAYYSLLSG